MKLKTTIIAICALCLLSLGVFAQDKDKMLKEHFEFKSDVMVGNTHLKKGVYLVKYNEETGLMTIVKGNNPSKVVATAKATMTMNEKEFKQDGILTRTMDGHEMLIGLRLGGQKEELTLSDSMASSQ